MTRLNNDVDYFNTTVNVANIEHYDNWNRPALVGHEQQVGQNPLNLFVRKLTWLPLAKPRTFIKYVVSERK